MKRAALAAAALALLAVTTGCAYLSEVAGTLSRTAAWRDTRTVGGGTSPFEHLLVALERQAGKTIRL